jgi:multiple sugar transport system ATP-binding protein
MVFQNYALYPHMTVRDNIGYPLKVRKVAKAEIRRRVSEVARMLGLDELLERKPAELSGGQRQRVAMGRAITREPAAFLMDEPLSNLDAKLRVSMRAQLAELHHRLAATVVYVTHDQVEAMTLGQRVAVLNQGRLQQVDTPQRLYEEPVNLFVGSFMGSPSMNLVSGTVQNGAVELAGIQIPLDPAHRPDGNGQVIVGIRPQAFEAAELAPAHRPTIEAVPRVVEELGSEALVIFPVDAPRVELGSVAAVEDEEESLLPDARASFTARVDPRARPRVDEPLRLAVDAEALYFFDPRDGRNLLLADVPRPGVSAT